MASVSVVIPCYNYAQFLPTSVGSVLSQQGIDVHVLIIDDASTDGSAEVATKLELQDDRVKFVRHKKNRGHIATYNEGLLDWADGDYSVLLSADDALTPGSLARATRLMDDYPSVGFTYGRPIYFDGDVPSITTSGSWRPWVWSGSTWIKGRCRAASNVVTSPEVVVRTAIQRECGGYRDDLRHAGDLEMWLRLAAHADVGYVRGAPQAFYRTHSGSMSRSEFGTIELDLTQRRQAFDAFFATCGADLENAAKLSKAVRLTLSREATWSACRLYDKKGAVPTVHWLADFALACNGDVPATPEWVELQNRLVSGRHRLSVRFLTMGAQRKFRYWLSGHSWRRRGVGL
jgi:glycosyltransferase involved in cell wall biosynthesis